MSSYFLEFKLPNFANHNDIEFCRQIYLNHFRNALLFFNKNSDVIRKYLIELLKIPGNDPSKDSKIIIYRWGCRCFFNLIRPPYVRPSVPVDFSFIHPELTNFNTLLQYASSEKLAENLIRLNDTFPYELFKVISMMIPDNARDFAKACAFNIGIPIHMCARIISLFPLNIVSIDFENLFEKRCSNSLDQFQLLFEGLLCSADFNLSQILAAQLLASTYDDLLTIENVDKNQTKKKKKDYLYLRLINTSIRQMTHFLDCNFALTLNLFQSELSILSFLLQTSTAPFSMLAKAVKQLPPNPYINRFNNQIKLMQFVGIGENWQLLNEHSIPFLIGSDQISNFVIITTEIPRSSTFLTLSSFDYQRDYDFIHAFDVFENLIKFSKLKEFNLSKSLFPSEYEVKLYAGIAIDIFSLIFTKKSNKNIQNPLKKPFQSNFVFDAETALSIISGLNNNSPPELKPFLETAEIRIKCALSIFERPVPLEAALLPHDYYFLHSLNSPELLDKLIEHFGNPPKFVISRKFTLALSRRLYLKERYQMVSDVPINPFSERIHKENSLNKKTEEIINETLSEFPCDLHSLLLLDFASTNKPFTYLAKKNTDVIFNEFVKSMFRKAVRFPSISDVDFFCHSLNELQKKLCKIISFGPNYKSNLLYRFSAFLLFLISSPSQTSKNFINQNIQKQILTVLQSKQSSFSSIIERFSDTGIDINEILYSYKESVDDSTINQIIHYNPLYGIPFALSQSFNKTKLIQNLPDNYSIIKKFLKKQVQPKQEIDLLSFLNDKDFINNFETKLDDLIQKNLINPLLQKLTEIEQDKQKVMMVLDYLVYKVDLSSSFDKILSIISQLPKIWRIQFLETFISLLDGSNEAVLFPLQQTLADLKPKHDFSKLSEAEKVCLSWDYLLKEVTKFQNVIDNPQRIYRLCSLHLVHHEIGHSLITLVQCLTQIIVFIRNFKIFNSKEDENQWLSKYTKYGISKLNESVLAEMSIDIGMNYNYDCGYSICKQLIKTIEAQFDSNQNILPTTRTSFSEPLNNFCISLSNSIKKNLPDSIKLLKYLPDYVSLADDILSIQCVNSAEDENELLHLLIKMKQFELTSRLYMILYEFAHNGVYKRYHIKYSGQSLFELKKVCLKCDLLLNSNTLIEQFNGINSTEIEQYDHYSLFGLIPNRSSNNKQLLFTSPSIPFNVSQLLYESSLTIREMIKSRKHKEKSIEHLSLIPSLNEISKYILPENYEPPTIYSLTADTNSISFFFEPFQSELSEIHSIRFPIDFKFFDLEYSKNKRGTSQLRIGPDMNASFTETLALGELKPISHQVKTDDEEINEFDLIHSVHKAIVSCSLYDLFSKLSISEMKFLLTYANEKSLLFLLLQIVLFVINNQDYMSIFIYSGSSLENNDNYNQAKVLDFLLALKFTLISGIRLVYDVDPSLLLPSSIIPSGFRKQLDDICLAIEYQLQIGIDKLNLFDQSQSGNIAHSIAQFFLNCNDNTDYDRGFVLTRVLHVDIDEVMIEAAAQILMKKNEESLGQFLLAILPRLDSSSSNQLIEALSSILVRNSANEPFLKLIISSIRNPQSSCQMLRWFGFTEAAVDVAVLNELADEIELSMKDATKKGLNHVARICKRWISQHKISA